MTQATQDPHKVQQDRKHKERIPTGRYTQGLSPLMIRVMLVNLLAVAALAGGVLYVNQFREELLDRRIENLKVQAGIISGALGEASTDQEAIDPAVARPIIARLVSPTRLRALLFNPEGRVVIDSRFLSGDKTVVAEDLPAPGKPETLLKKLENYVYHAIDFFDTQRVYPPYIDRQGLTSADLPEVAEALEGYDATAIRQKEDGVIVIQIALPVQRLRRVLGAIELISETDDIEAIVRAEQLSIIRVVLVSFTVTLMISFFLGRTLALPIRQLAKAAIRVRRNIGREEDLPAFADRRDEIGDLSRALSDMTRALYTQIDAVERFAADVAHEIKNPLTSMRSALETLKVTDKPEHRERLLAILADDVQRLDRLISDISDASRLDAELTRAKMDRVDLKELLSTLVDAYKETACTEGPFLSLTYKDSEKFLVSGIEARLGQVWRNLIDNAITFTPKDKSIALRLVKQDRTAIIYVDDEGTGLSKGAEDKIFKRFYSERPEPDEEHNDPDHFAGGTGHSGLGLAISKQVVEAHGGSIHASNRLDDQGGILGARFEVRLPIDT